MLMGSGAEIQLADHQTVGEVRVMQFDLVSAKSCRCSQYTRQLKMLRCLPCLHAASCTMYTQMLLQVSEE